MTQTQSHQVKSVTTAESLNFSAMVNCMEGLGAPELTMIRRLAGNDGDVRKKTLRKLRKWLASIGNKLPECTADECRNIIEPNFIRVWKALFYCMWMADKPLPQEQLAEQLSELQIIFKKKPVVLLLFNEWFFRTVAREWPWIDRFRMDKFMMLIRRFLRASLTQLLEEYRFKNDVLEPFMEIISIHVFNRFPTAVTKKTRAQLKIPDPIQASLGFQIHFVDIFMEEVAKVCGEELKSSKVLKILKPFINELALNDDERLTGEIREKVFHYLMRQSDVGIDFQEGMFPGNTNDIDTGDDDDDGEEEDVDGDDVDDKDMDEMVMDTPNIKQPMDPRAGSVDVILPQLDVNYVDLAKALTEAGGGKNVRMKNRKLLYSIARGFQELVKGDYPLAVPKDTSSAAEKRAIKRGDIKEATVKLLQLDNTLLKKTGKSKKIKVKKQLNSSVASAGSGDSETSAYINDSELLEHLDDNYMSYLEEMHQSDVQDGEIPGKKNSKKKKKNHKQEDEPQIVSSDFMNSMLTNIGEKPKRRKKRKMVQEATPNEVEVQVSPKKTRLVPSPVEENPDPEPGQITTPKLRRKKLSRFNGVSPQDVISFALPSPSSSSAKGNSPTKIKLAGNFILSNSGSNGSDERLRTPLNKQILTPSSAASSGLKKRVSFVMARNLEHPHDDYQQSIERSPAIPYNSERQPEFGLLKSPANRKRSPFEYRAKASDFF